MVRVHDDETGFYRKIEILGLNSLKSSKKGRHSQSIDSRQSKFVSIGQRNRTFPINHVIHHHHTCLYTNAIKNLMTS